MAGELRFDGKVAVVTGAGNGLGRSHALLLASRGAKVVVNDLGGGHTGGGKSSAAADKVVEEITAAGGQAVANYDSVEDGANIVKSAIDAFGRIDILINNAGILRDTSFQKMSQEDWDLIYRVHVLGAFRTSQAAWPYMRDQKYGRIIFTASAAGIYGNFGQVNYAMAKLGLVGMSNTLAIEGRKNNVFVNTIAPIAGSRMTETVLPKDLLDALKPEYVSTLVAYLSHEGCEETGGLFEVGGGLYTKLRWERTEGVTYRLGRPVTLENLKNDWKAVTDFSKSTHPANIAESMGPIMTNVEAGQSKGGNQFIDVDRALGWESSEIKSDYAEKDVALYALGVGAGRNPTDPKELALVYEMNGAGFTPLPTMTAAMSVWQMMRAAMEGQQAPGLNYGLDRVLHGEQYTEVLRPLPTKQKLKHRLKIKNIFDKGKGAVVVNEVRTFDEDGELLAINEISTFVRGAGGWGGERGPSSDVNVAPERKADFTVEERTSEDQALLYRLSGDINPLHADPQFAKNFGFDKPILHGLCTFGFAARHVIGAVAGGDPKLFRSIRARFAEPVFPGETLITEIWKESPTKVIFRTKVKDRDKVVISNAAVELYTEVPKTAEKPKAAASAGGAAQAEPTSADVFGGIQRFFTKNPDTVAKIATVFQFKLANPESVWTLDLKKGAVEQGATSQPECTLEISDADFMAMCTGKADAMKLFTSGKLKIGGNIMASQKLEFLKKVDPSDVMAAMKERTGSSAATTPAASPSAAAEVSSGDIFSAIGAYIEQHPDIAERVKTNYLWKLSAPDSVWTMDLKTNKVVTGAVGTADCTLELADADFLAMTSGKADPMKLFTTGKLKIGGNIMASQKLDFLQKLDKNAVAAAVANKKPSAAAARTAAPATSAAPKAPAIFKALGERLSANAGLAAEVGANLQFVIKGPDASWALDGGKLIEGKCKDALTTVTLTDADLAAWTSGKQSIQSLYQHGNVRVDGDVRAVHRLGFMSKLG